MSIRAVCNNNLSVMLFEFLESYHVPTFFLNKKSSKSMIIKEYEPIPISVLIRNTVTDTLYKKFGIEKDKTLESPIIEYYLKNEKYKNPFINEYHIYALEHANSEEMKTIARISSKINAVLKSLFNRRELKLIESNLEFGRINGKIALCSEITMENSKLSDINTKEKFDYETLKKNSDSAEQIYKSFLEKMNISK